MLVRYEPFAAMRRWTDILDRELFRPWADWTAESLEVFRPGFGATDITEDDEAVTVKVDLPGLRKEDIAVETKDGLLTIRAERRSEREEKGKTFHRVERTVGRFMRRFALPDGVDVDATTARYEDGVLTVVLPKTERAKGRKVEVQD